MIRLLSYIVVVIVGLLTPLWVFMPIALAYMYIYGPYEVCALALLIDVRFGDGVPGFQYWYSFLTIVLAGISWGVHTRLKI